MWCSTACTDRACRGRRAQRASGSRPRRTRSSGSCGAMTREPLVAPIRTLRADTRRPEDRQRRLHARGDRATRRTRRGAVGRGGRVGVPAAAGRERRMASARPTGPATKPSGSRSSKTSGATTDYARGRAGARAPIRIERENDRHLQFVHDWQPQLTGPAVARCRGRAGVAGVRAVPRGRAPTRPPTVTSSTVTCST